MQSHLTFGIPLPLQMANVYRISAKNWLSGRISVPEGILAVACKNLLDAEAENIARTLRSINPTVKWGETEKPKYYTFSADDVPIYTHALYALFLEKMPKLQLITIETLIEALSCNKLTWEDAETLELVELIKDYDQKIFEHLKRRYEFLNFVLR